MKPLILFFAVFASVAYGKQLFTVLEDSPKIHECAEGVLSCKKVQVDFDALRSENQLELPNDMAVTRDEVIELESGFVSVSFRNHDKDLFATFTYSTSVDNPAVFGDLNDGKDNRQFSLEECTEGANCFVWKEIDHTKWGQTEKGKGNLYSDVVYTNESLVLGRDQLKLVDQGRVDTTTPAVVTVTIYTTVEFRQYYNNDPAKIRAYAELAVAETTQGYANSGVPMVMKLHCVVDSDIRDADFTDMGAMLDKFTHYHNQDFKTIRFDADMAVLLTNLADYCGIAWFNVIGNGQTLGVCSRGCAVGYFTFGHETGHMFGCAHNKEIATNSQYPLGFGYLMKDPFQSGYRTNMAYAAPGYNTKLNYYSNPNKKANLSIGMTATSDGTADNAGVLTQNRFLMSQVGAESISCGAPPPPPPTTLPPPTTPPPSTTPSPCYTVWLGDGYCDDGCNTAGWYYDKGDCCNNPKPDYKMYCKTCECKNTSLG